MNAVVSVIIVMKFKSFKELSDYFHTAKRVNLTSAQKGFKIRGQAVKVNSNGGGKKETLLHQQVE